MVKQKRPKSFDDLDERGDDDDANESTSFQTLGITHNFWVINFINEGSTDGTELIKILQ